MNERYMPPETRGQLSPAEVTSVEDMTQFLLTFRRNNGIAMEDREREQRYAARDAKQEIEGGSDSSLFRH